VYIRLERQPFFHENVERRRRRGAGFLFIYFPRPAFLYTMCIYTHYSARVDTVYEFTLLPNNAASEYFYTNREWCKVLTGYVFIIGVRAWR